MKSLLRNVLAMVGVLVLIYAHMLVQSRVHEEMEAKGQFNSLNKEERED